MRRHGSGAQSPLKNNSAGHVNSLTSDGMHPQERAERLYQAKGKRSLSELPPNLIAKARRCIGPSPACFTR